MKAHKSHVHDHGRTRRWAAIMVLSLLFGAVGMSSAMASAPTVGTGGVSEASNNQVVPTNADGFDALPSSAKALSYSALVNTGQVHPNTRSNVPLTGSLPAPQSSNPNVNITWGTASNISGSPGGTYGANEPAAALHPSDGQRAMAGGNTYAPSPIHTNVENTTDQGTTWARRQAANCSSSGDGVPVWLASTFFGGLGAINTSLCSAADGLDMAQSRTTDGGGTWTVLSNNLLNDGFYNDREYLWTDYNPSSPFFGRTYMTEANFGSGGNANYLTISVRATTDGGQSYTPNNALVASNEFATSTNHNEYPSLAILPNGHVVAAWHRGMCCGGPSPINSPNKVMWSRSTDGGVTFPVSGTIVTVPLNQSVPFNATSPGGFRWSDTPNIGADPTDGTLYATWVQYRTPSTPGSSAAYVSHSTDEGASWSTPVIADNSNIAQFQYMPWLEVSTDHTVHLTFSKQVGTTSQLGHFYVQSTDGGNTWSTPFQLSANYSPTGFMGDYQALDIGGYSGGQAVIFSTWTQSAGSGATEDRWGRFGTFSVGGGGGTPTPTLSPTSTPSSTPSSTPTPSVTPTFTPTPTNTAVPSATNTSVPSATNTAVPSSTETPVSTGTAVATFTAVPSATPCTISFTDVHTTDYFYEAVTYLACHGAISGYSDGSFRPYNNTTRGQLSKIVVLAVGWTIDTSGGPHFSDVPPSNPFYPYIETAYHHGVISGYGDGTFRWGNNVTRGQLSKIVVIAIGWDIDTSGGPHFSDVPTSDPFYTFIETAFHHSIISGYADGTFRPGNNATRGQISKIVYLAITQP